MTNIVPMRSHPPGCQCGCEPRLHPPGCQCGCGDRWICDDPNWGRDLMQCWDQINQLKCIVKQIMDEVGGPIRSGPIRGVVDGSNAKPGDVGEFIHAEATMAYAAYPQSTRATLSVTVIPPGDWDLWASMTLSTLVGGCNFYLSPMPTGMSNIMQAASGFAAAAASEEASVLIGQSARGNFSTPTLLPFLIIVNQTTADVLIAGQATLVLEARRIR